MATKKKMLQAAAGNAAGGAALDITDVFSTYLYTGTGGSLTVNNGIDLDGEGGLVWFKNRQTVDIHALFDSERPLTDYLRTNGSNAASSATTNLTFTSSGFSLNNSFGLMNSTGNNYASWTFRKAPKFFDVVTYTGTGSAGLSVSHNLGSVPGMILVKQTNASTIWPVYHRGVNGGTNPENYLLYINGTASQIDSDTYWNDTAPTDSVFTVGTNSNVNASGGTYVAYLFAHNDGDGEFGPSGDQDIIKCGSYTGNGSSSGVEVDLGFEPQWVLVKSATSGNDNNWHMYDNMRGITTGGDEKVLYANASDDEYPASELDLTSTGFKTQNPTYGINTNGTNYIYMAIRRGPLAPPESGTEVFDVEFGSASPKPWFKSGFPVDFGFFKNKDATGNWQSGSRLTQGTSLNPNLTNAEEAASSTKFDYQNGWYNSFGASTSWLSWMWKRAPGFFDVVAYTGNGTAGRTVSHNLGVAPEMMWVKRRDNTDIWAVYNETVGNTGFLRLNDTNAVTTATVAWNDTSPTATDFTLGTYAAVNTSSSKYIAYLFASLPGISKVGSYTGNGTSQTIGCGFTSGARFILVKRTDSTGDWYVWDTERGIVAGNDPHLSLNTTAAEVTSDDSIDPDSSGFIVNQVAATNINVSSAEYIFYAVS
jgi:hypothetical protein